MLFRSLDGPTPKKRHPTEKDDKINRERVIDSRDVQIRKAFNRIKRVIETTTSETKVDVTNVVSTPIRFAPGSALLDDSARKYLTDLAGEYGRNLNPKRVKFCIVASATDQPVGKDRWILSTERAQTVSKFVQGVLSDVSEGQWTLTAMGSGAVRTQEPDRSTPARQEFVRIAIMGVE